MRHRDLSLTEQLDAIAERFQPFPNVTAGSYCSMTQSLRLDGFADEDVKAALRGDVPMALKVMPVLVHECQHMVDHLCTLFGRQLLARTYDAMEARLSGQNTRFAAVAELFRSVNEIHRNDYFFDLGEAADRPRQPGQRWIYRFTTGMQLDLEGRELADQPVFFVRFDHPEGGSVARVPISVAALLEARAMAAEVRSQIQLASSVGDPTEQKMYLSSVMHGLDQMLYDPLFVKYTVAAHTAANLLGGNNLVEALEAAARLSGLCLMMPTALFRQVRLPDYRQQGWRDPEEAARRGQAGLRRCDRGHLFLVLVTNLAERGGDRRMANLVADALEASDLPPEAEVLAQAGQELIAATRSTTGGRFAQQYSRVVAIGDAYHLDGARDTAGVLTRLPAQLPPLILRQNGPHTHGSPAWSHYDHMQWVDACSNVTARFKEFVDACGLYRSPV